MIWPEKCFICGSRVNPPRKPVIMNPATGHAFCKHCNDLPGFWRTFWDEKDVAKKLVRAVEEPETPHAK